ncbi:heavy metal sensor histidine kinase [Acinetobacter boissieri]|uniref:Sensor protein n=1 Tax=Acinetobacter boissieri TaxID=1219383 RepID=A0A1G6GI29_9GAMM|nr:two-component system, OmpR family, heavy metal sensor histidine kinase CusS [Acinetobacter boissieri]
MIKIFNTISLKIALIFSLCTAIILLIMGFVIHQLVTHHFAMQDRAQIEGKIQLIQHILKQDNLSPNQLHSSLTDALVGHHDLVVQIEQPMGHIIFQSTSQYINKNQIIKTATADHWLNWKNQHTTYHGLVSEQQYNAQPIQIIVGIDTSEHLHFLNNFRNQLLYIGLGGTAFIIFFGWFAAWRGLRPIQKMAQVAEGISAQHLSERLATHRIPLELQPLAIAFNDMLDRLEKALAKLSDFSSDLAHEIRTPLNNLMTQTQVCLSRPRQVHDYKEVLFSNLEELEHLSRMISDMLFLAKTEHGLHLTQLQQIHLEHEIQTLIDFYDAVATEKNMAFHHIGSATICANPTLLRRALSNLFSNAIKYGQAQSMIETQCQTIEHKTIFSIKNKGPILSQEQLSRLFDRFYRTDTSRQRMEDGTGLGLAITQSILNLHGAKIDVKSCNDEIIFTITFELINDQTV